MSHQLISFSNLATLAVGFATPYVIARIWRHFGLFRQELSGIRRDVNNDPAKMSTPAIVPTGMKDYALWNTALFFPCPRGDDPDSSINKLLFYLRQAENSIKLCVMTLTYGPVYELLIQKHQQGIQVLVFTSFSTATGKGKRLGAKGIPVKSRVKGNYSTVMHNKYAIIDDEAVLTGSMNWTSESIYQQRENILVTTDHRIVPKFVHHFELMWTNYWLDNRDVDNLDEQGFQSSNSSSRRK